ncbi:MAG TPA: hypothetical protein DDY79_16125, partial [Brevundimonas sp.]|nr:hypothetical protein [Brevundimonas sp.]
MAHHHRAALHRWRHGEWSGGPERGEDRAHRGDCGLAAHQEPFVIPVPSETAPVVRRPFYRHLYFQVLIAIALGALIGHFWPEFGERLKPLGDGFIKLVKMVIAPVIFLTIVTGIAGMRDLGSVGRVAAKAFAYFLVFSTLALIVGLIIANIVRPGHGLNIDPATLNAG